MSLIKSTFVMIVGVAAYAVNAYLLEDIFDKSNVCHACRCGCICKKSCLKDVPDQINVFTDTICASGRIQ